MFDPFTVIRGVAAPLPLANVDTDVIIRIERLTIGDPAELGHWAFESLRYREDGREKPEFVLNRPVYRGAPILLAGPNFGCGSSREGAVTALLATGIRCVIADGFGDIFYANCFQNGLLPIRLAEPRVLDLMARADGSTLTVDLVQCVIALPGVTPIAFEIDPMRREALLAGVDDIGLTMRDTPTIAHWQTADRLARPWIWNLENVA